MRSRDSQASKSLKQGHTSQRTHSSVTKEMDSVVEGTLVPGWESQSDSNEGDNSSDGGSAGI